MRELIIKSKIESKGTNLFRKIALLLIAIIILPFNANSAQIISPLLADLPSDSYSSDSHYLGFTAESAFNGGIWNAGDYGWHWIQADMGSEQSITQLKITTAQAPNGVSQHQVYSSNSKIGAGYSSLTPIDTHNIYTTHGTVLDILFDTPQLGRFFLILVHGDQSWTAIGDEAARSNWEQQVLNVSAVPLPPAIIAFTTAMFGISALIRRRRKQA